MNTSRVAIAMIGVLELGAVGIMGADIALNWKSSGEFCRVIVNATQGIESRPRVWFSRDWLVTDLKFTNVNSIGLDTAQKEYMAARKILESYSLAVGTYISGTNVLPRSSQSWWPPQTVSIEDMPGDARYYGTWPGNASRKIVDLTDRPTRHSLQTEIQAIWRITPAPVRFVDNAAVHHSSGPAQDWSAYCANIREIRVMGSAMGSRQIFNLALNVGYMSDQETQQLIQAVSHHGVALETPWRRELRRNPEQTERARHRYRQMLDAGMAIVMLPLDGDPLELAQWVRKWRKSTDRIYIQGPFQKPPDEAIFGPGR
ncbi:MAG: hypothetical protein U0Q18_09880 [Bryobacteraceae bacterium]